MPFGHREMPDIHANTIRAIKDLQRGMAEGYVDSWTRRPSLWGLDNEFVVNGHEVDAAMAIEIAAYCERKMYNAK